MVIPDATFAEHLARTAVDDSEHPETMNLAQAAAYLHLGYEAAKKLFRAGQIPGVSLNQKHTVFLREDLANWLHERAREQSEARRLEHERQHAPRTRRRRGAPLPDLDTCTWVAVSPAPQARPQDLIPPVGHHSIRKRFGRPSA